tara:strand:- start:2428 stop:2574 length:147 start_codon:yes stop_codon:yes gene_type:complete
MEHVAVKSASMAHLKKLRTLADRKNHVRTKKPTLIEKSAFQRCCASKN